MGFAGRPGGPSFYISTIDNTENHGPGSQGSDMEADSCFGLVVQGRGVVERMMKQGPTDDMGRILIQPNPSHYVGGRIFFSL